MQIACIICTDLISADQEIVSTTCGHLFHCTCIQNWLKNSRTCATCRQAANPNTLIKMYFEISGDNKSLVELSAENFKLKEEAKEINSKLNIANERIKSLDRTKQCDDMALAGFRVIKEESEKEIVKLKEKVNTLSLDLLAEKQLRRIHQKALSNLDPNNVNYDISTVACEEKEEEENARKNFKITPFWKLDCETKAEPENSRAFVIPSKIQKADLRQRPKLIPESRFRHANYYHWPQESRPSTSRFSVASSSNDFSLPGSTKMMNGRSVFKFGDTSFNINSNGESSKPKSDSSANQPSSSTSSSLFKPDDDDVPKKISFCQKTSDR